MINGPPGQAPGREESEMVKEFQAREKAYKDSIPEGSRELTQVEGAAYYLGFTSGWQAGVEYQESHCADLLAACEAIHEWLGTDDAAQALPFEPPWYQQLRAAMAKAKGES